MRLFLSCLLTLLFFVAVAAADELKGKIQAVDAEAATIDVFGVQVNARAAEIKNDADKAVNLSALAVGDRVGIEGAFTDKARMSARKIAEDFSGYDEIKGKITSADAVAGEIIISGVKVKVRPDTWLEGPQDLRVAFEELRPSVYAGCEGVFTGALEFNAKKIIIE
ncbi:MAG: hypothetical protein FJZ09_00435 [Candidatus Omnitrophica bacterium]|nr:hypothetical protein [Candidatus Omnitrophota bacterium]